MFHCVFCHDDDVVPDDVALVNTHVYWRCICVRCWHRTIEDTLLMPRSLQREVSAAVAGLP